MPKRKPRLGREPARNYEQFAKRTRLFCTEFCKLIHLHSHLQHLSDHANVSIKKLFEAACRIHCCDAAISLPFGQEILQQWKHSNMCGTVERQTTVQNLLATPLEPGDQVTKAGSSQLEFPLL